MKNQQGPSLLAQRHLGDLIAAANHLASQSIQAEGEVIVALDVEGYARKVEICDVETAEKIVSDLVESIDLRETHLNKIRSSWPFGTKLVLIARRVSGGVLIFSGTLTRETGALS